MADQQEATFAKPMRKREEIAFHLKATCTVAEACAGTGLGRTLLYELMGEDKIKSTTVGRRRLILVPSLLQVVGFSIPEEAAEIH